VICENRWNPPPSNNGKGTELASLDQQDRKKIPPPAQVRRGEPNVERWRVADFDAIELIYGVDVTQDHPRHWHDELYISATLNGTSYLDCLGTSLLTRRGTLAIVAPGDVHANRKVACDFRCIFLDFRALEAGVEQFVERSIPGLTFRSGLVENQCATARFLRAHRAFEPGASAVGRDDFVFSFLYELAARHSTAAIPLPHTGNEDFAVRRTRHFLDERYAECVSLRQLSQLTGLSAYHLNRSFRRKIGMPPHEYQLQVRILKAKSFLRRGRSISETAFLVGFVDQSHFTRHFKRSVGVTPGKFLR
jgi:AraC-like DNA-binding protein